MRFVVGGLLLLAALTGCSNMFGPAWTPTPVVDDLASRAGGVDRSPRFEYPPASKAAQSWSWLAPNPSKPSPTRSPRFVPSEVRKKLVEDQRPPSDGEGAGPTEQPQAEVPLETK